MLALPGVIGLIAARHATRQLISPEVHAKIRKMLDAPPPAAERVDPLDGKPYALPTNTARALLAEHFSDAEHALGRSVGLAALRSRLGFRLGASATLAAVLAAAMLASQDETTVTLGFLALTILFVIIPWDATRVHLMVKHGARLYQASDAQIAHCGLPREVTHTSLFLSDTQELPFGASTNETL